MATARSAPVGTMLENGYQSLVAFEDDPDISFWEKDVQPMGFEGGDKIEITTMHNTTVRTYAAQALPGATDGEVTAAYDPAVLSQIVALVNVNNLVTFHFPDGSSWDFYGFLGSFVPSALTNGEHPEATCSIMATNVNDNSGAETTPAYNAPAP